MAERKRAKLSEQTSDRMYEMIVEEARYAPGSLLPGILLTKTGVRKVGGRVWGKVSSVKIEMDTDQDRSTEFRGVGAAEEDG